MKNISPHSSNPLRKESFVAPSILSTNTSIEKELIDFLLKKNGCFLFSKSVHIYSDIQLDEVNRLLREKYDDLFNDEIGIVSFAQDIFGVQFVYNENGIFACDLDTGETQIISESFYHWLDLIFYNKESFGSDISNAWIKKNGEIDDKQRLVPKLPFCLGGKYEVENLVPMGFQDMVDFYYQFYITTKDVPDGKEIRISFEK
jgi:hypothetical protein